MDKELLDNALLGAIKAVTLHDVEVSEMLPSENIVYRIEVEYVRDGRTTGFAVSRSDKTAALLRCLERLSELC